MQSKLLLGELGEMLKDRHVTNNGSIHKVCANAVNRPVTIEFLHGGIAHGRDLMLAAQQREIRAEVPVAVADRFAERSERVRAGLNERISSSMASPA